MNRPTDVMVDLETMGTTADAVIISIGAVAFCMDTCAVLVDAGFYRVLDLQQCGRHVSAATRAWWESQSEAARAVLHTPADERTTLRQALAELQEWASPLAGDLRWWSNGAAFDLPILAHAYAQHDMREPWRQFGDRCYRTYKNLPGARNVPMQRTGTHHNALDDAIDQARHLCAIHAHLFGGKTP
jgi:exodeoxyribonuclease VIII